MDWLFVTSTAVENAATFSLIRNYPNDWELDECKPVRDTIPQDAEIRMDPDFPKDIELVDCLYTGGSVLYVNEAVVRLLEAQGLQNIEILPIRVINHKKKPVKESYFLLNPLTKVDCIDTSKSKIDWSAIDPDSISVVHQLAVDMSSVPEGVKFLRPERLLQTMIIHRTVAEAIKSSKLRGFLFTEIAQYRYP